VIELDGYRARSQAVASSVLIAIPAHNEDRYIGSVVLKLRAADYQVLVIDDGSTDRTAEIAAAAGARVIQHSRNLGKAAAVRTAFSYARAEDVDALVLLDGDSQHDPFEVARVVQPVLDGRADMVVGSRFAGLSSRIPRWRRVGQHALTLATNVGSGVPVSDSQSGFRAFSRRALEGMRLQHVGFSVESEMQFEAKALDLVVEEIPISVHYDVSVKRNPVSQGLNVLDAVLRLVAQHRPLLFFSAPGLLCVLAGVALGVHVVRIYEATLTLAVGYSVLTVLLSVVGVLATFIGIMLHTIRALFVEFSQRA
jgi:glycosyltransferase involved in cell wall biosynthesis